MTNDKATPAILQQLVKDDAVGQLRRRDGLMATLGSEDGVLKLDWVEGVARLLTDPTQLEEVEAEARDIWQRGKGASLSYLDVTVNGEAGAGLLAVLDEHVHTIGNKLLGNSVKLRKAPADYHSTEQSEMDGPPSLLSLRLVARNSEAPLVGSYTTTFLHAQAVSTWQAMMEAGRPCFLLVIDGSLDDAIEPLATFFSQVEEYLHNA